MKAIQLRLLETFMIFLVVGIFVMSVMNFKKEQQEEIPIDHQQDFQIKKLFTHEGVTVYRFYDLNKYHYFTCCEQKTLVKNAEISEHENNF
jgi:hypothetical protein